MSKTVRAAVAGVAVISMSLWGIACKHGQKDNVKPEVAPPQVTQTQAPPPRVEIPVPAPKDFVPTETPRVTEEPIPSNIDALNRYAQEKGYIQDAFYNYDEASL